MAQSFETQRPCIVPGDPPNPPNPSLGIAENHSGRRDIDRDYVVIEYNASNYSTAWYDYHHFPDLGKRSEKPYEVLRNGSFLPVVFTREKIAVHVCGLRFLDQLTVTTSPLALPEGGADIRGYTPTTVLTSLSSTLDALQTAGASGGAVPVSGLGYSTTGPIGTITVSGIAPGTLSGDGKATYTGANITLSGAEVAQYLYAFRRNADALADSIYGVQTYPPFAKDLPDTAAQFPGSIDAINKVIDQLAVKINTDANTPGFAANAAAFDEDLSTMQGLAGQLTTLAGSLSSLGFGARAVALQNNYAVLRGILDFATLGFNHSYCKDLPKTNPSASLGIAVTPGQLSSLSTEQIKHLEISDLERLSAEQVQSFVAMQLQSFSDKQLAALLKPRDAAPSGPDTPACSGFEYQKFSAFKKSYEDELKTLDEPVADFVNIQPKSFELDASESRKKMFTALHSLGSDIENVDIRVGSIFSQINDWQNKSSVEQTDLIAAPNNNALLRISMIVQHGYTPFTLANTSNSVSTLAATATTSSTTTAAASTSTPAHAVKTVLVEVHRLANFNLAGGVMLIHVPSSSFSLSPPINGTVNGTSTVGTTTTNNYIGSCGTGTPTSMTPGNASTYSCVVTNPKTNWQVTGMAGIAWYPFGRDYFPRRKGYTNYARNYIPSLLVATSITSFGSGFGGLNFEPLTGIDFFGGIASANSAVLPSGVTANTMVPSTGFSLIPGTQVHTGLAFGIAFDFGLFGQVFSKTTPVGTLR